jgi:hypothetical protein
MAESWMIDELAHAGPEHLDPAFVAAYDRKQGYPDPAEDLAAFEAHGLDGTSAVLDLGAGSGQFALPAARRFGHVTVYTRNALHQLPDFWKALALDRIAGMLRPGGVLRLRDLIYDFRPGQAERVFRGWMDHAAQKPADGYTAEDYAVHIRTEFSTFRWLLEPILAEAGFEIVTAEFERRLYGAYTCIKV